MSSLYHEVLERLDRQFGAARVDGWMPGAQAALGRLRRAYRDCGEPDYGEKSIRLAYVLAYHPGHLQLARWSFAQTRAALQGLDRERTLRVAVLGAGPGAEILALAEHVDRHFEHVCALEIVLVDRVPDWAGIRRVVSIEPSEARLGPRDLRVEELEADLSCDAERASVGKRLRTCDLVIAQAIMSEVFESGSGTDVLSWLGETLPLGSAVLLTDLPKSKGGRDAFSSISSSGLQIAGSDEDSRPLGDPPRRLTDGFFAQSDGLRPRQWIHAGVRCLSRGAVVDHAPSRGPVLSVSQETATAGFERWLRSAEQAPVAILRGAAGTGKTVLVRELVRRARAAELSVRLLAPTGMARRRLAEATDHPASTIHSALYSFENDAFDDQGGRVASFGLNSGIPEELLIVDEASMVGDSDTDDPNAPRRLLFNEGKLLSDLLSRLEADDRSRRILFVGDNHQLPPVGEHGTRPALNPDALSARLGSTVPVWGLEEVRRQAEGSTILDVATRCRGGEPFAMQRGVEDVSSIECHAEALDAGSATVIAWTNATVAELNRKIRRALGRTCMEPVSGERLLVVRTALDRTLVTGDEVRVESTGGTRRLSRKLGRTEERATVDLLDVVLSTDTESGRVHFAALIVLDGIDGQARGAVETVDRVLTIDAAVRYEEQRSEDPSLTKEAFFRDDPVLNALRVTYPYARTCHRAQGAEWDTVIVDAGHFPTATPGGWEYTAVTRARQRLLIHDRPALIAPLDIDLELAELFAGHAVDVLCRPLQHNGRQLTLSRDEKRVVVDVHCRKGTPSRVCVQSGDEELGRLARSLLARWSSRVRERARRIPDRAVRTRCEALRLAPIDAAVQITFCAAGDWEFDIEAVDDAGESATLRVRFDSGGKLTAGSMSGSGVARRALNAMKDSHSDLFG